jgi:hypothetical protein
MNRPTVPPVRQRGDDPILDALAEGRGDGMLLARMERRLRRVSWMPAPTPWTAGAPWTRRYARSLVLVTFALLAPGLVALSLVAVQWAKGQLRAEAVAEAPMAPPSAPVAPAPGVPAPAPLPAASEAPATSAPALPEPTPSATAAARPVPVPTPSSALPAPPAAAPSGSSPPVPAGPLFTPELDY